ncbi:MAG: ATP-dependent DNA helicase [Acetilactobacillus jinshanensis]
MAEDIKAAEQKRLNSVIKKINLAELKQLKTINHDEKNERVIQKDFYNDVRLRSTTYSGLMETGVEVRQKQQMLDQLNSEWHQAQFFLKRLRLLAKNPYFARIDFKEPNSSKVHTIYIGLASFADHGSHYLVYDWRAPISSIYYENKLGRVTYHAPSGPQTVNVILKRQFQIKDGKIKTVFDTKAAIGDQLLLSNLSRQSTPKMRNIVTTIQADQNRIIRDTDADLLYVQGAAGSGKTSAALQRVAYLLYHYRPSLTSRQIILFSPNQLFNDYVNHVLPSLGEHNMVRMTYYQYSDHRVPHFNVETLAQRFSDDNLTHHDQRINNLKNSLICFNAVNRYLKNLNQHGMHFKNIIFNHHVFISKEQIAKVYYQFNSNYDLSNRLDATKDHLLRLLRERIKSEMKKKWVSDAIEDMNRQQLRYIQLSHPNEFQNVDNSYRFLAKHIVIGAFRRVKHIITRGLFINLNLQYLHLLKSLPKYVSLKQFGVPHPAWQKSLKEFVNDLDYGQISMADVSIYLYLHDRLVGSLGHPEIKYIFIDEAQDYTGFQMALIHYEFPKARFTVLADLNQAIFTHRRSHHLFGDLKAIFKGHRIHKVRLIKSYRSTQQITDFTKYLLPDGQKIQSFARQGSLPKVTVEPNRGHELKGLIKMIDHDRKYHTTALIGKNLKQCRLLNRQLKQRGVKVHLIQSENQELTSGVLIVPAYLAKGLEFDAVIMLDASRHNYASDHDRQLAYTICTRAMHRLDVISIHDLSPLFKKIPKQLYH